MIQCKDRRFFLHRVIYDRDNILVSGGNTEIKLISKGDIKFMPEMLYNGFSISFTTINNITSSTILDIYAHPFQLVDENGGELEDDRITPNMFITIYYSNAYHSFCIFPNSYIKDEIFIGAQKHSPVEDDISGSFLQLDGDTYNWADYPRYKEKCGGKFNNPNAGNINPVAYTGGASICIDPEEQKQIGISVYGS